MQHVFDHEKLRAYKTSLEFLTWLHVVLEKIPEKLAVYDQLDRVSTSIPLNIAEGNGKYTERDRCTFFDIARGSTLECAAAPDVLIAKGVLTAEEVQHGKGLLLEIVSMLTGVIKSNSSYRVYESSVKVHARVFRME